MHVIGRWFWLGTGWVLACTLCLGGCIHYNKRMLEKPVRTLENKKTLPDPVLLVTARTGEHKLKVSVRLQNQCVLEKQQVVQKIEVTEREANLLGQICLYGIGGVLALGGLMGTASAAGNNDPEFDKGTNVAIGLVFTGISLGFVGWGVGNTIYAAGEDREPMGEETRTLGTQPLGACGEVPGSGINVLVELPGDQQRNAVTDANGQAEISLGSFDFPIDTPDEKCVAAVQIKHKSIEKTVQVDLRNTTAYRALLTRKAFFQRADVEAAIERIRPLAQEVKRTLASKKPAYLARIKKLVQRARRARQTLCKNPEWYRLEELPGFADCQEAEATLARLDRVRDQAGKWMNGHRQQVALVRKAGRRVAPLIKPGSRPKPAAVQRALKPAQAALALVCYNKDWPEETDLPVFGNCQSASKALDVLRDRLLPDDMLGLIKLHAHGTDAQREQVLDKLEDRKVSFVEPVFEALPGLSEREVHSAVKCVGWLYFTAPNSEFPRGKGLLGWMMEEGDKRAAAGDPLGGLLLQAAGFAYSTRMVKGAASRPTGSVPHSDNPTLNRVAAATNAAAEGLARLPLHLDKARVRMKALADKIPDDQLNIATWIMAVVLEAGRR